MQQKISKFNGLFSILINIVPFLLFPALITQQGDLFTNILPFAIYYAFRRSALILFRDWEHQPRQLGWIGLISGAIGYGCGIFGQLSPLFFDFAGVGAGIASTLYPTAINQGKRLAKQRLKKAATSTSQGSTGKLIYLLSVIILLGVIGYFKIAILNFTLMLITTILALIGYSATPFKITRPAKLHWFNYGLGLLLLFAMLLIRVGRSRGIGQPVTWGIILLAVFLIIMVALLAINWRFKKPLPSGLRLRSMLYGVCAQYWTLYSTVFIGAVYGIKLYYLVIVAYLCAILFGGLTAKLAYHYLPFSQWYINISMIAIGILMTFWLPTYFVGIFLIRSFASREQTNTIDLYEQTTKNYNSSYLTNYYYSTAAGLVSQLVMWGSLLFLAKNSGLNRVLSAFALKTVTSQESNAINLTHLILACYMLLFIICSLVFSKQKRV